MASLSDLRKRRVVNTKYMDESMQRYKDAAKEAIQQSSAFELSLLQKSNTGISNEQIDILAEDLAKAVVTLSMDPVEMYLQRLSNAGLDGDQIRTVTENIYNKVLSEGSMGILKEDVSYEDKIGIVSEFFERKPYLYDEVFLFY